MKELALRIWSPRLALAESGIRRLGFLRASSSHIALAPAREITIELDVYKRQLNTKIYDEVIAIENEDAFVEGRSFAKSEGILVGISSGAALKAAQILAARPENAGKTIVALLPDSGDRYLCCLECCT